MTLKRSCFLVLLLALGCAHMDSAGEVSYADGPEKNFLLGQDARDDKRYLDALKYYEHVRYKFPYSSQAALADLAIADTHFEREKYVEAIEAYRQFLKLHPNHPQADYAEFRVAVSYYRDIPSDFFLFPPSTEKDQGPVRDTRRALEGFLREFPTSKHATEAEELLADVRKRMATHEMHVADFYRHRERWAGAIGRLNTVLDDYPGLGLVGEALLTLGESYLKMGDREKAKDALHRRIREYPQDAHRSEAQSLLDSMS